MKRILKRWPAVALLLAGSWSTAGAGPGEKTARDHLREGLAREPLTFDMTDTVPNLAWYLRQELQVSILVDPLSVDVKKEYRIECKRLAPKDAIQAVLDAAGLKQVSTGGMLLWASEKRMKEWENRKRATCPEAATDKDKETWKTLTSRTSDAEFEDITPEDISTFFGMFIAVKVTVDAGKQSPISISMRDATCIDILEVVAFYFGAEVTLKDGDVFIRTPKTEDPPPEKK